MRAGTAQVDITPEPRIELCGFARRIQPSTGILDPLFAKALFLEHEGRRLLWIVCDLIGFSNELAFEVRRAIQAKIDLKTEEVVLSATHTHYGPATVDILEAGSSSASYLGLLEERIVEAARLTVAKLEQVEAVHARVQFPLAVDRTQPEKPVQPQDLSALGFRREDGAWLAVLTHFAMHPVALGPEHRLISRDWPGTLSDALTKALKGNPVVLTLPGACGDLDPPTLTAEPKLLEEWGLEMAGALAPSLQAARALPSRLDMVGSEVEIPFEILDKAELDRFSKNLLEQSWGRQEWGEPFARAVRQWTANRKADTQRSCRLQATLIRIGEVPFACLGAEPFHRLQTNLPECKVVACTNGLIGYLAPAQDYDRDLYETQLSHIFYDSWRIRSGGFEKIERAIRQLIGTN